MLISTMEINTANTVTYRLLSVSDDLESEIPSVEPGEVYPGGATIEKATPVPMQTLITNPMNGQVFVIGSSGEIYSSPGTKTIAPRESNTRVTNIVKKRDDRRRATHNEVERRRRDKINNWIIRLSKIIPSSTDNSDKTGLEGQSKGGILAKACEYIIELKNSQLRLSETVKDSEVMASEIIKLNQQITNLKKENASLRYHLSKNGIVPHNDPPEVS
ncbi:upstream stimulatory factor 1-like isoform X2 [Arctopsyche grandis]|uniref:upstream stimulatory factor 1-like isoform X2 n=1 Tax=Arctopsyche grandis TaxID=121162 RepID=UPI00406D90EC